MPQITRRSVDINGTLLFDTEENIRYAQETIGRRTAQGEYLPPAGRPHPAAASMNFHAENEMHPNEIVKAGRRDRLNAKQSQYLAETYHRAFSGIFTQQWVERLQKDNLSPYDLIFIDGRPASQVFAEKGAKAANPEEYAAVMKQQIALTALSSNARIDYVQPATTAYGDLHFGEPARLNVKVQAREKKPSFWERIKSVLRIEPIPASRQQAAAELMAADPDKGTRQSVIQSQLPDFEAPRRMQLAARSAIHERERLLNLSDDKFFGNLRSPEGTALTLDQALQQLKEKEKTSEVHDLARPSARNGLVELYALSQGMPLEQIISDDPRYDAQKAQLGQRYFDMVMRNDPHELAAAFGQMGRALNELPAPSPESLTGPQGLLDSYIRNKTIARMYIGFDQGIHYHQHALDHLVDEQFGPESEKINATLSHIGEFTSAAGDYVDQMASENYVPMSTRVDFDNSNFQRHCLERRVELDQMAKDISGKQQYKDLESPVMHYMSLGAQAVQACESRQASWAQSPETFRADMQFARTGQTPTARFTDAGFVFGATDEIQAANARAARSRVTARDLEEPSHASAQKAAKTAEKASERSKAKVPLTLGK